MSAIHNITVQSQSIPRPLLPPIREGQGAYLVGGGDSISNAYPFANDSKSFQAFAAKYLWRKYTYKALGHDGWRTDQILSAYSEVIDEHASIVTVEGGLNNVFQNVSVNTIVSDLQAMVNMAVADGSLVVYIPILPWTDGTDEENAIIDVINATMIAWMQANHPGHLVADARPILGQFRPGGPVGNLWDIKAAFDQDRAHYNVSGQQELGEFIGRLIVKNAPF